MFTSLSLPADYNQKDNWVLCSCALNASVSAVEWRGGWGGREGVEERGSREGRMGD